jgi:DNA-binding FadR family transcriptional regulator
LAGFTVFIDNDLRTGFSFQYATIIVHQLAHCSFNFDVVGRMAKVTQFSGHDAIAAVLGSEILSGVRRPGSRMPSVEEMFESFGVSRVVMREVTKTLAAKGLVASKTRVGTIVRDPADWNWIDADVLSWRLKLGLDIPFLAQITDVRRAVEPVCAALAARHRSRDDLARMRKALRTMTDATDDPRAFSAADLAFHVAVSTASGNPLLRSFTAVVEAALSTIFAINSAVTNQVRRAGVEQHAVILDAIAARDEKAAAHAMQQVIGYGFEHAQVNYAKARRLPRRRKPL